MNLYCVPVDKVGTTVTSLAFVHAETVDEALAMLSDYVSANQADFDGYAVRTDLIEPVADNPFMVWG